MRSRKFLGLLVVQFIVMVTFLSAENTFAQSKKPPFGRKADVAYGKKLWTALEKANLVGHESIRTVPYKGRPPHGAILEAVFAEVMIDGKEIYVIVKKNYGGKGMTKSKVANNGDKYLKWVTVMAQREAGFDAKHKNWFWAKFAPDGKSFDKVPKKGIPLVGKVKGCIACHSTAEGGGMVFLRTAKYLDQ